MIRLTSVHLKKRRTRDVVGGNCGIGFGYGCYGQDSVLARELLWLVGFRGLLKRRSVLLFGIRWHLGRYQSRAACSQVAMARRRHAVDDDVGIARDNYGSAAVPFERAGHLVANARDPLAICIRGRGTTDHGAAVACAVAEDDEGSGHVNL